MILADTSVWIDHLRRSDTALADLLESDQIVCHPFVVGELACGSLRNRAGILASLSRLPMVPQATHTEALWFLDNHAFSGRGIGWIDVHLLASLLLAGDTKLWTRDRRLAGLAESLGLSWPSALN